MTEVTNDPTSIGTNAWTNPTYAYLDDTSKATAVMVAKNTCIAGIWGTFGFTDPGGETNITKVEIGTQHYLSTISSIIATMGREISWDGGSSWGSHDLTEVETEVTSETATLWADCTADTAWTWTKLNDTNLKTRVTCYQGNDATGFTMSLDVIYVRVTYNAVAACEVYAAEAILSYEVPPTEVYAAEAILNYVAPAEVYAAEAILDYSIPPTEVYAAEAILNYTAPTEVYAAEAILDYAIAENAPCEAYAAEAILNYVAPAEVYASEAILDYEVPPCEVYTAEAILDYIAPAEVYATEAILDYEVPPAEVYAAEVALDYVASAEVYAAEAILSYEPAEVAAPTGGGSSPPFKWYIRTPPKAPAKPEVVRAPRLVMFDDSVDMIDYAESISKAFLVWDEIHLIDEDAIDKFLAPTEEIVLEDVAQLDKIMTLNESITLEDSITITSNTPLADLMRTPAFRELFYGMIPATEVVRARELEVSERVREYARVRRRNTLASMLSRSRDPSLTLKIQDEYARALDKQFVAFKHDAAKILNRRELSDDWDEIDAPDLMDKFVRTIEVTITIPGTGIVRKFTTRAYTTGGYRSSQFLNSLGIKAVFSILPADQAALDILITRDLSGLKGITDEMSKQIMAEITDGMLRGDSMDKVAKAIDDRIDSIGRARAETLARTETMKAFNEGSLTQYDKHGITEVEWLAAPGERTCDECMSLDGQRFPIDSKPDCPLHPNCRCVLLPVIPDIPKD